MRAMDVPALAVEGLSKAFGGLRVVSDLAFGVPKGHATALIGPNGAGKTTVFNLVSGVYRCDAGTIRVNGTDVTDMPASRRIRAGIARSFQNIRLMSHLTVLDNLMVAQHVRCSGLVDLLVPFRLVPRHPWKQEALAALAECGLDGYADDNVGGLPYGVRKQIDLVRASLAGATVLMLDEPAAGLNPTETEALRQHLCGLIARGVTLIVVEHDMHFVARVCERVVVLNFGRKIAEGTLDEVRRDPHVREAYLGGDDEVAA